MSATEQQDPTAAYNVTTRPSGAAGPGKWPVEAPTGQALQVLHDVVRSADEPAARRALEIALTFVLMGVVIALTLLGQRLDDRVGDLERENDFLRGRLTQIEAELAP